MVQPGSVLLLREVQCTERRAHRCLHGKRFLGYQALYDLLSTVPMVHVKVNNSYLFNLISVLRHGIAGCYCHIINETEAVAACFSGVIVVEGPSKDASVVAWWPRSTECVPVLTTHDSVNGLDCCPSSQ